MVCLLGKKSNILFISQRKDYLFIHVVAKAFVDSAASFKTKVSGFSGPLCYKHHRGIMKVYSREITV